MTTIVDANAARKELVGFKGELVGRSEATYEGARKIYNAFIDKHPAYVAKVTDADDIARVLDFAQKHELPLAVRGGGHNGAGLGSCDDGVVIDLSLFRSIQVDPERAHCHRWWRMHLGGSRPSNATRTAWPPRAESSRPPASEGSHSAVGWGT